MQCFGSYKRCSSQRPQGFLGFSVPAGRQLITSLFCIWDKLQFITLAKGSFPVDTSSTCSDIYGAGYSEITLPFTQLPHSLGKGAQHCLYLSSVMVIKDVAPWTWYFSLLPHPESCRQVKITSSSKRAHFCTRCHHVWQRPASPSVCWQRGRAVAAVAPPLGGISRVCLLGTLARPDALAARARSAAERRFQHLGQGRRLRLRAGRAGAGSASAGTDTPDVHRDPPDVPRAPQMCPETPQMCPETLQMCTKTPQMCTETPRYAPRSPRCASLRPSPRSGNRHQSTPLGITALLQPRLCGCCFLHSWARVAHLGHWQHIWGTCAFSNGLLSPHSAQLEAGFDYIVCAPESITKLPVPVPVFCDH